MPVNVFAYRMPGEQEAIAGASGRLVPYDPRLHGDGWVFASFGHPGKMMFIPADRPLASLPDEEILKVSDSAGTEFRSTPEERHTAYISRIIDMIHSDSTKKKVVAARTLVSERKEAPSEMFRRLCAAYPDAFVFLFAAEGYGAWVGASPELLLSVRGDRFRTMALAGTRPAGSAGDWDAKNLEEQQIVTDFIADTLRGHGLDVRIGRRGLRRAGPVEHLMTPVAASGTPREGLTALLACLSPTPALCGMPKEWAMRTIMENEAPRRLYGGFMGPVTASGTSLDLYVNLRSATFSQTEIMLFAGGGITGASEPAKEWEETERKLSTLAPLLTP